MICPKCGSNNPKDPLQCIRCGYIFPEYISKHNIDVSRSKKDREEQKRVEAIRNFKPTSKVSRIPIHPTSVTPRVTNVSNEEEKPQVVAPTKIKRIIYMGRNGINRFDDIKECFIVSIIYTGIILLVSYLLIDVF